MQGYSVLSFLSRAVPGSSDFSGPVLALVIVVMFGLVLPMLSLFFVAVVHGGELAARAS